MYYRNLLYFLFTLITFVFADDEEKPKKNSKGRSSSVDTNQYAGVYQMTYYYNLDKATNTTQLKCNVVDNFTLTIPDASSSEVQRDISNITSGKDPIYGTQQGSWVVKELASNEGFDAMKLRVFIDDVDETLVCWDIAKQGNDILINLDPHQPDACPTRFIPTTKTCLTDHAFLFGKCLSGVCAGEKPKVGKGSSKENSSATLLGALSFSYLFFLVFVSFFI